MKNRVPSPGQAGRVLVTPEDGGSPFYATIAMADNPTENGTPWSMESVLQDATAALFGLGADAVPDDLFAYLGRYAQHWWRRRKPSIVESGTKIGAISLGSSSSNTSSAYLSNISYSSQIEMRNGSLSLSGSIKTVKIGYPYIQNGSVKTNILNGMYFEATYVSENSDPTTGYPKISKDTIYKGVSDISATYTSDQLYETRISLKEITISYTDWEYVQSSSRSAYPDSGEQDGYEYEYLGIPFDNAVKTPKIETGSYTGTGTYGSSNPNSLTFGFVPKFVLIQTNDLTLKITMLLNGITATGNNTGSGSSNNQVKPTWSNNTVSWYVDGNADNQRNISGKTYYYIAIG